MVVIVGTQCLRQCINYHLLRDDGTILGVGNGIEPGLDLSQVSTSDALSHASKDKLNANVFLRVPKRFLDEFDVRSSPLLGRIESNHICRKGFQESEQFVRWCTVWRRMSGDQP
jgi:hypothetical protein